MRITEVPFVNFSIREIIILQIYLIFLIISIFNKCHHSNTAVTSVKMDVIFNILRPWQNGSHFPDDTFKSIFLNENVRISIKISLKFVPKGPINKIPALVQMMAWHRPGDKPLSEPMMVRLLMNLKMWKKTQGNLLSNLQLRYYIKRCWWCFYEWHLNQKYQKCSFIEIHS